MYAFDAPGPLESVGNNMMSHYHANTYVMQQTLTSYPCYHDPHGDHLDPNTAESHTFTFIGTSTSANGQGPYQWTASK